MVELQQSPVSLQNSEWEGSELCGSVMEHYAVIVDRALKVKLMNAFFRDIKTLEYKAKVQSIIKAFQLYVDKKRLSFQVVNIFTQR